MTSIFAVGCSKVDLYCNVSLYFVEATSDMSIYITRSHNFFYSIRAYVNQSHSPNGLIGR